jgi:hypothetical protein
MAGVHRLAQGGRRPGEVAELGENGPEEIGGSGCQIGVLGGRHLAECVPGALQLALLFEHHSQVVEVLRGDVAADGDAIDRALRVGRDHQPAPDVAGELRVLVRGGLLDLLEDVIVELLDRHPAVRVPVGLAGLQPSDHGTGEHRRALDVHRQPVPLEGVLGGRRRRDDHPAAAAEPLDDVDAVAGPGRPPLGKGAAVAAVQEQDDPLGHAVLDAVDDIARRQPGGGEPVEPGVGHDEVESAAGILHPVAGQVQQQRVVRPAALEEVEELLFDDALGAVEQRPHLEAADVRVAEDASKRVGVMGRCHQLPELRVVMLIVGDDERCLGPVHRGSGVG